MSVDTAVLQGIAERVLEDFFQDDFQSVEPGGVFEPADPVSALIRFHEAWYGAVSATCSYTLARGMAATMFEADPASLAEEEVEDALGEVANMVAGHLKQLLPEGTRLSVPTIHPTVDLRPALPGGHELWRGMFDCAGERLVIAVFACEAHEPAPTGPNPVEETR